VLITLVPAALANPQSSLLDSLKLAGVLQRLSLSYLLAAPIILLWSGRHLMLVALIMLAAWLGYMLCIPGPLPGGGAFDPLTNAAQRLDVWLLGEFSETSSHALATVIPAAILMLFGGSCASVLLEASDRRSKQLILFVSGIGLVALGVALGSSVPYVRRILSPSFVLVTAGSCTVLFAILYEAIDIRRTRLGTLPFIAFGANAIVIFAASEILRAFAGMVGSTRPTGHWESLWDLSLHVLERQLPAEWAGFLMSLAYLAAFSMLAVFLYRRDLTFHV
jgi:predicted acyltransferase